jgi:sugar-specific transcriptional regulator TrmB
MTISEKLRKIGLNELEANIYCYLLESGIATPPQIARGTDIARTNCYHILSELKHKSLIQEEKKGKRKAYIARDPQALFVSLEERRNAIEDLLPDLRALYASKINKPTIRFCDGWDEVKEIYRETLSAEKIMAVASIEKLALIDPDFFQYYQKQLEKNKIIFYDILNGDSREKAKEVLAVREALHEIKFLPAATQEISSDILIWKDTIALIALEPPIFGTVIRNKTIARTFSSVLETLWGKI